MKILQLNNSEAIIGGSDRVYHDTSRLLHEAGHEVVSLACGPHGEGEYKQSHVLPRNGYRGGSAGQAIRNAASFMYRHDAAAELRRILQKSRPDIAHLHIFYGQLSSAVLSVLSAARVPTVMSVHEYRMLCPVSTLFRPSVGVCEKCAGGTYANAIRYRCNRGKLLDSALSAVECWFRDTFYSYAQNVDHFAMVSAFCRRKHVEYLPELEERSSVLYNFVERSTPSPQARPDGREYLLYAGRLSPEKGVGTLLSVAAQLPHVRIVVAGTGALEDKLVSRYSQAPNIEMVGHLGRERLGEVVAGAKYCVVPSEWYENNPMSVLESFARGVPVLASNIGGIPEVVVDGITGFLFAPSDARALRDCIEKAWHLNDADYAGMKARCLKVARTRHAPEAYLDALLTIYSAAITRKENANGA